MTLSLLKDVKSLERDEVVTQFKAWGEPAYRADQLMQWLYQHHSANWQVMANLPLSLRKKLEEQYTLQSLVPVRVQGSRDTTQKFLWRLGDGNLIESVLIPANPALYSEGSDRHTLCVSTQVGCAYGCKFCASGLDGWKRNLEPHEIVEQIVAVERLGNRGVASDENQAGEASKTRQVDNIVVMGMGEPLANYDHLIKALRILNAPYGMGIGARKITISTSGLAPRIRQLAAEPMQFRLAISLHGATDAVRNQIMPVNRKYPLAELVSACRDYQRAKGRMITLEYILIAGVNDALDQARPLANLARNLHAKINLIPYNKVEGLPWERPSVETCENFLQNLLGAGVTATLRREKGHDIDAACGQLRLKVEKETQTPA